MLCTNVMNINKVLGMITTVIGFTLTHSFWYLKGAGTYPPWILEDTCMKTEIVQVLPVPLFCLSLSQ